jgi:Rod binding domain-containing protein
MESSITPVSRIPAQVRADGAEGRKLWEASLGFESFLVRTMAASMTESIGGGDDETDASTATVKEQLPEALTSAITGNGGLGLAEQLYTAMRGKAIT